VDNPNDSNFIIDLIFLRNDSMEINNNYILPELQSPSDYAPLIVNIIIKKKFIQDKQHTIIKNSKEEKKFINELKITIGNIDTIDISDKELLERYVQEYINSLESLWNKYSKYIKVTKCSKAW